MADDVARVLHEAGVGCLIHRRMCDPMEPEFWTGLHRGQASNLDAAGLTVTTKESAAIGDAWLAVRAKMPEGWSIYLGRRATKWAAQVRRSERGNPRVLTGASGSTEVEALDALRAELERWT